MASVLALGGAVGVIKRNVIEDQELWVGIRELEKVGYMKSGPSECLLDAWLSKPSSS